MTDPVRIDKHIYKHRKFLKARELNPGSVGLWLMGNAWCRDHRRQGRIPMDVALQLGDIYEIQTLVDVGLWTKTECDGEYFDYHDYRDWNPDMIRNGAVPSAMWIVQSCLPDHPSDVQQRLASEVRKLIDEGVVTPVIEAALQTWDSKPEARVSWLSYYVSDAIKARNTGIRGAIALARRTHDVSALREFGFRWTPPAPPHDAKTADDMRRHVYNDQQRWLDELEKDLD